jgi:hypothetical protein
VKFVLILEQRTEQVRIFKAMQYAEDEEDSESSARYYKPFASS